MKLKKIEYWDGRKWKTSTINTDSIKVETGTGHTVSIMTDRDVKKVEVIDSDGSQFVCYLVKRK